VRNFSRPAGSTSAVEGHAINGRDDQTTCTPDTVGTVEVEPDFRAAMLACPDHRPGVDMLGQREDHGCHIAPAVPPCRLVWRLLVEVVSEVDNNIVAGKPLTIIATVGCTTPLAT
jgi:hypothetical protein